MQPNTYEIYLTFSGTILFSCK